MSKNIDLQYYQELAHKWLTGSISPEEKKLLDEWYKENGRLDTEIPADFANDEDIHSERMFAEIRKRFDNDKSLEVKTIPIKKRYWQVVAAASVIVIMAGSAFFYLKNYNPRQKYAAKEILPGNNGAVLRLWNGKDVVLNSTKYGDEIATIYNVSSDNDTKHQDNDYNVLSTPNGKQWKMLLPDGTKVLLNAGSSLKFPASFSGKKERMVELTGEAYFDVVHNEKQPFKVKAGNEIIEDIGTVFNVYSYSGERVKATLVKGAIKIGNHVLKPGQQAIVDSTAIRIKSIDAHDAIAWTEGQFSMENITVQELMNQLSRWYNIPVEYIGVPPTESFGGLLDRNVPLSNILNVLNANGINAKIENEKIIVSSK